MTGAIALTTIDHAAAPPLSDDLAARRLLRIGFATIAVAAAVLGGWTAITPLDSAVVTYGVVTAEGNRRVVQHPDGGIVSAIAIREGDRVSEGQELMRLDTLQPQAALDVQNAAVDSLRVSIARLEAERAGSGSFDLPQSLAAKSQESAVADLFLAQSRIFETRRRAAQDETAALAQQIEQARSQSNGLQAQVRALDEQYRLGEDELGGLRTLLDSGLTTKTRVLALEKTAAAIIGQKQEYLGNIDRLEHTVGQLQSQTQQVTSNFQMKVAEELDEARTRLSEALERQRVLQDVLDRTSIRAPTDGTVLGLTVHTIGAVIGRGDRLLEIVPAGTPHIVQTRIAPADGAHVQSGMRTEVRLLSPEMRRYAPLRGTVRTRSADLLSDGRTEPYYALEVAIDDSELVRPEAPVLSPGTPIEVIVPTGSRTALEYMFEPILDAFRHGMRER
jgi:HlyD family type I secretion membrane fusion protein